MKALVSIAACLACCFVLSIQTRSIWLHRADWTAIFIAYVCGMAFTQVAWLVGYFRIPFMVQKEIQEKGGTKVERAWVTRLQMVVGILYILTATHMAVLQAIAR